MLKTTCKRLAPMTVLLMGTTLAATATPAPNFTAAQVKSGTAVYTKSCASCHGAKLEGAVGPALSGAAFLKKWADGKKTLGDLETFVAQKMPLSQPHSLTDQQYLNVMAFILSQNGYKAGNTSLDKAGLNVIFSPPASK